MTKLNTSDDLPYRIVEQMGLGLTFRSCTCGQLPCARLRPIRDALDTARSTLAQKVLETVEGERLHENLDNEGDRGCMKAIRDVLAALRELFQREGIEVKS